MTHTLTVAETLKNNPIGNEGYFQYGFKTD